MPQSFSVQMYYKGELALLYFPSSTKKNALQNFNRWVHHCKGLREALVNAGYTNTRRFYSRREVQIIVDFLGEP